MSEIKQQAFVLRIVPSRIDRVPEALDKNQIIIGWAEAEGLLDSALSWEQFREIIRSSFYAHEPTLRKAGGAAGHMWRFVREMNVGDLVVVPHGPEFFVAKVNGPAKFDPTKVPDDTAYRRDVQWLNDKKPIRRVMARSALVSRMKAYGTCTSATDLLDEIKECLLLVSKGQAPTFQTDLHSRLVGETLKAVHTGFMDPNRFEGLIQTVLTDLGGKDVRIVAKSQDKGADVLATFHVAGAFPLILAVQAKLWQPEPPVGKEVVEQLIKGIEAESADLGMVITAGTISDEAVLAAQNYFEEKGVKIELVDGEQFAKLIVEHGVSAS